MENCRDRASHSRQHEAPEQRSLRLENVRNRVAERRENEFLREGHSLIALAATTSRYTESSNDEMEIVRHEVTPLDHSPSEELELELEIDEKDSIVIFITVKNDLTSNRCQ